MLLYTDSFDHYLTADILAKWTTLAGSGAISAGNGRRSSACARCTLNVTFLKSLSSVSGATAILGVAFKTSALAANTRLLGVYDGVNNRDQVYLTANADGSLTLFRGGTTGVNQGSGTALGTSAAGVLVSATYAYVELKVLLHASAGTAVVRVNGTAVLTLSGVNTTNGVSVVWNGAWIGNSASSTADFDDLYVLDGSGSAPWNDVLGDCRVDPRLPTGAGATTGWTPLSGANWQNVDDAAPNGDTDYNFASTAPLTDTYVVQDAPVAGATIYGVQQNLYVKKTDAGVATFAGVVRHSGTDNVGATLSPGTAYAFGLQVNATNPGTGAAWVEADFNAAEFGIKRLT